MDTSHCGSGQPVGVAMTVAELVEQLERLGQPEALVKMKFDDFEGHLYVEEVESVYSEHPRVVVIRAEPV